jgi:hypothetical protein
VMVAMIRPRLAGVKDGGGGAGLRRGYCLNQDLRVSGTGSTPGGVPNQISSCSRGGSEPAWEDGEQFYGFAGREKCVDDFLDVG